MSLPKFYSKQFRDEMACHPVWQPGFGAVPGDIGVMKDGVFVREGSYSSYTHVKAKLREEDIEATPSKFSKGVSISLSAKAQTNVDPTAEVGGTLKIEGGGGVLLHVSTQRRCSIDNLREVLNALPWNGEKFGKDTVFVAEVRLAKAIALVLSETGGINVEVSGKAKALQMLDIADGAVSFGSTSAAAFTASVGNSEGTAFYPYGLLLYKRNDGWRGTGKPEPLEASRDKNADVEPFEELSHHDASL